MKPLKFWGLMYQQWLYTLWLWSHVWNSRRFFKFFKNQTVGGKGGSHRLSMLLFQLPFTIVTLEWKFLELPSEKFVFYLELAISQNNIESIYLCSIHLPPAHVSMFFSSSAIFFFPLILFFVACGMLIYYQEEKLNGNCFHTIWDIFLAWTHILISNHIK